MTEVENLRARLLQLFSPFACDVQIWASGTRLRLKVRNENGEVLMDLLSLSLAETRDAVVMESYIIHLRALCPGSP